MGTQNEIKNNIECTVANSESILKNHEGIDVTTVVSAIDGNLFTSSLIVAKLFEKNHFDVLKAIKNLECSKEFNECNFVGVEYVDAKGEKRPAFNITRDGFAFLAMGFTGKKGAAWKERFLEAFNAMEAALREQDRANLGEMKRYKKIILKIKQDVCKPVEKYDQKDNMNNVLRAVIAYWAFVDEIPLAVAEQATAMSQGLNSLAELPLHSERFPELYTYAYTMGQKPAGKSGPKATEESFTILNTLLMGIQSFNYSAKNHVFITDSMYDLSPDNIENFCQKDIDKLIMGAWSYFSFQQGVLEHLFVLSEKLNGIISCPPKG